MSPSPIRCLASLGNNLLAGGDFSEGIYISTDDGIHWQIPVQVEYNTFFFVHDAYIFAAERNSTILRSSDSGDTWTNIDSSYGERKPNGIGDDLSCLSMGSNAKYIFGGNDIGEIYRSSNNGDFWQRVYKDSISYPDSKRVDAIMAIDSIIVAQVDDSLIRSTDNGSHWTFITKGEFAANTFIVYKNIIFSGGYFGVQYSIDSGLTWISASQGMPDSIVIDAFAIKDDYLFAGGALSFSQSLAGGLWRRPLSDFTNAVHQNPPPLLTLSVLSNPVTSSADFEFSALHDQQILELFDMLGRSVLRQQLEAGEFRLYIDMEKYPAGIYVARLGTESVKLIKK